MTRACVIGAGVAGLALAIRLQSAGLETTLVEARERVGGAVWAWEREGFTFDAGPSALADTSGFAELWQLSGRDMADDLTFAEVSPIRRYNWPDGVSFDLWRDPAAMQRELARFAPGDIGGYDDFLHYCASAREDALTWLARDGGRADAAGLLRAASGLTRQQGWRSLHAVAAARVKDEHLREALALPALLAGANPMRASARFAERHAAEVESGAWWPLGGMKQLAEALAGLFETLGGRIRLHDPVLRVHALGDRASEVECASGWRERFDVLASSADRVHTVRDLLADAPEAAQRTRRLQRRAYGPGMFSVYFGLEGAWPGIPHQTVLFGPRFEGLFKDIFEHGVLPRDMLIWLDHPSVTDPSLAPPGKSTFRASVPVANLARLPVDWEQVGPVIERRVLEEVGRRLIPDLDDRIVVKFAYTPRGLALDMNAFAGSAFGVQPSLADMGWARQPLRDAKLKNLWYAGADVYPGSGLAGALASARAAALAMAKEAER